MNLQDVAARPLSAAQGALVNEAIALVTPELYDSGRTFPEGWRNRVREEFTRNEAIEIFESLGPAPDGRLLPNCNCATDADCTAPRTCKIAACSVTASGCGPGGADQCNERCLL